MRKTAPIDQFSDLLRRKSPLKLTEDHILSLIAVRRARIGVLGSRLFSDPAWDILLELYAAHLGDRTMTVSELTRAIDSPPSAVRRWMAALEQRELVKIVVNPNDQATAEIKLTTDGVSKMKRLADHWGSAFVSI